MSQKVSENEKRKAVKLTDYHKSCHHAIRVGQICWDQGVVASKRKSKYNVPYDEIIGMPVDKDGIELHSEQGEIAGYKLSRDKGAVWEVGIGKYRTSEDITHDGKPIIVSVDEFESIVKEAAQTSLGISINRVQGKLKDVKSRLIKVTEKVTETVSHKGRTGRTSNFGKIGRIENDR